MATQSGQSEIEAKYIVQARNMGWPELRDLWDDIERGSTPNWERGKALEYLVLRAFELDGCQVTWPYKVEDLEQIDGAVYCGGLACLLECKDHVDSLNIEPIAKLRNQLLRRPSGVIGLLVGRNGFTEPAQTLAQFLAPQCILLYEGSEIEYLLKEERMVEPLLRKYRFCVERGLPTYNVREEVAG